MHWNQVLFKTIPEFFPKRTVSCNTRNFLPRLLQLLNFCTQFTMLILYCCSTGERNPDDIFSQLVIHIILYYNTQVVIICLFWPQLMAVSLPRKSPTSYLRYSGHTCRRKPLNPLLLFECYVSRLFLLLL